jgi:glyoxylase-like metal-dependent hydrolase (beta-lactamase superfamily II)
VILPETFQIYAIRYARVDRGAAENFLGGDPHNGPMPLDFFVWAVTNARRTLVVDTGFNSATAARRKREFLRCPTEGLRLGGIDASAIEDVIVTHMHYDHIGNFDLFPNATFHLQDREMAFTTGRHMCHPPLRNSFDVEDVVGLVRKVHSDRVQFHDGEAELFPGLSLHWVGGHTAGIQVVRVWTQRGWVVLASDATHFYANMEQDRPFPVIFNVGDAVEAFRTLRRLADSPRHIVPGHDPLVLTRYPAPRDDLKGIVARLDLEPST